MSEPAIRVQNLGKLYRIGPPPASLRETLAGAFLPWRRKSARPETQLWAVRNVSFEVQRGEAIAIIGRNGAGKSTILKMLSRITGPTEGSIAMYGKVGALLEVGTGFHPELTGRENIFLNGAILGMSRSEVKRKFDEIVAFSETERFLDTPVKHYSSGMHMRLAFSVSAHFEPEILIVDEVLAVGDAGFQRKCLGKVEELGKGGRTVVFVTHDMAAVNRLCQRAILIDQGRLIESGTTAEVVRTYLGHGKFNRGVREWTGPPEERPGDEWARLRAVRVRAETEPTPELFDIRRPIGIDIEFEVCRAGRILAPCIYVHDRGGELVFWSMDHDPEWHRRPRVEGRFTSTAWIPGNLLAEGTFVVGASLLTCVPVTTHFFEREVCSFQVADSLEGDSARGDYGGVIGGNVRPLLRWTTRVET